MHQLLLDVRSAMRQLRRAPSFATLAIMLLTMGIGGAAAVFSVLNVVYYRPMPYPDGDRLAILNVSLIGADCGGRCTRDPSPAEARAWMQESSVTEVLGSISPVQGVARTDAGSTVLEGAAVTQGVLDLLAPRAVLGRGLAPSDFAADAPPSLVLSHSGWQAMFGGDSSVIGRRLVLRDVAYTLVGVLSPRSELEPPLFSLNVNSAQFWIASDPNRPPGSSMNRTIARLHPGADRDGVRRQLDVILRRHGEGTTWTANVQSLREAVSARYRASFWYLLGAVALLLGIACLNVGGMFLARLNDRAPELATRVALGATRWDVVRYVLIEATLITAAGGIGGCIVAYYGASAARLLPAGRLPSWELVSLDWRVLVLTLVLTVVATVAIAVAPLIAFRSERLLWLLRERTSAGATRSRARGVFVSAQIALSLILLAAAGALARILVSAELRDIGMTKHSLVYVQLQRPTDLGNSSVASTLRLLDQLRRTPTVLTVAAMGVDLTPSRNGEARDRTRDGAMVAEGATSAFSVAVAPRSATDVTPDYFTAMGMKITRGRAFGPADGPGAPLVAILDEPTAQHMFPDGSALGRRIKFGDANSDEPWLMVVGVAAAVRNDPLETAPAYTPQVYRSMRQFPTFPTSLVVRVAGSSSRVAPALRRAVGQVDPSLAIASIVPVERWLGARMWEARFNAAVIGVFAIVALLLACFGVYAAISYLVSARQRELGIRMALGATQTNIVTVIVRSGVAMLVPGLLVGFAGSVFVNRVLRSLLYGAPAFEPAVLVTVVAAISVASFVATLLPARRVAAIHPVTLLRSG